MILSTLLEVKKLPTQLLSTIFRGGQFFLNPLKGRGLPNTLIIKVSFGFKSFTEVVFPEPEFPAIPINSAYIYRPIMDNLNNPDHFHIFYISLEMKAEVLLAKLLSTYIFETYNKEISYKEMLSKTRNTILSDEDYELIKKSIPWMEKVMSMLTIWDKSLNSASFFKLMKDLADKNGKFYEEQNRKFYTPDNPDKVVLVVIDHLALSQPQTGNSLKNEMDAISKVAVQFRNRCNFSFLMIMQANREAANVERRKLELVEPQRQDVKDSSCMEADSDIMIAEFLFAYQHLNLDYKYTKNF